MNISVILLYAVQAAMPVACLLYLLLPVPAYERRVRHEFLLLLLIATIGCAVGGIKGHEAGRPYFVVDLFVAINLTAGIGAALGAGQLLRNDRLHSLFVAVLVACSVLATISLTFRGGVGLIDTFLRGSSTPVRYAVFYLGLYGLALVAGDRNRTAGYILAGSAVLAAVLSLNKWSIPIGVIVTASLLAIGYLRGARVRWLAIAAVAVVALSIGTAVLQANLLDFVAKRRGYNTFATFVNQRVVYSSAQTEIGRTGIYTRLQDGGRFEMWTDIVDRTVASPVSGIGIGSRPIHEYHVGTHNAPLFLFGAFGIPIFLLYTIQLTRLLLAVRRQVIGNPPMFVAFAGWGLAVLFAFNVGASFQQAFNTFFAYLALAAIFFRPPRWLMAPPPYGYPPGSPMPQPEPGLPPPPAHPAPWARPEPFPSAPRGSFAPGPPPVGRPYPPHAPRPVPRRPVPPEAGVRDA